MESKNHHEIFKKLYAIDDLQTNNTFADLWSYQETFGKDEINIDNIRGNVLDIACGKGRLVKELKEKGVNAIGIDKKPLSQENIITGSAEELPFKTETFDYIFMHRLIPNYFDFIKTGKTTLPYEKMTTIIMHLIKEAYRVLKEGGNAYINLLNWENLDINSKHFIHGAPELITQTILEQLQKEKIPYETIIKAVCPIVDLPTLMPLIVSLKLRKGTALIPTTLTDVINEAMKQQDAYISRYIERNKPSNP